MGTRKKLRWRWARALVLSLAVGCGASTATQDGLGNDSADKAAPLSDDASTSSATALSNGVPVTGLSGAKGTSQYFVLVVPAGVSQVSFTLGTGTSSSNDADLYVRASSLPTKSSYACRSINTGLNESCVVSAPTPGNWYVRVYGYSAYSGAVLTASYGAVTPRDAGTPPSDGGVSPRDGGVASTDGGVGPGGGSVDHLFFAVVGDTRPSSQDATGSYPTAIIQKIYGDIEGMNPRPQFVVSTGDYMYASTSGSAAAAQISLYHQAAAQFSGAHFAAMGNHECTGFTDSNCATTTTANYQAFFSTLVAPLGMSEPYYEVPVTATDGSWTAKLLIVACNAWSSTQQAWLTAALARATTYTFVVRHEPASAPTGPCVNAVEQLLASHPYDLSIVGHTHTFSTSGREVIVGTGGAPLSSSSVPYGYATVEQVSGGFRVTQYDYATALPVKSVVVAH